MMSEVFINSIEGTIRRAQAYANIYKHVGFKPFYLSDFNDMVDYSHQISSSMLTSLRLFRLVRKTGNRREYDVFLGEWNGIKHIKKGYSYEWQLEFDSDDSSMLATHLFTIIHELASLYDSIALARMEAFDMMN